MIFGINLISIGIVLAVLAAILTPVVILTKMKNRKKVQEKIKERKDSGEDYTDLTEKLKGFYGKIKGEASSPVILPAIVYVAILISFAILLPDIWTKYWGHQNFFWISQVYLIAIIALSHLNNWFAKFALGIAFTVILVVYGIGKIPEDPPAGTIKESSFGQPQQTTGVVRFVKIFAPAGREAWSKRIQIPDGYDCIVENDPAYGLENMDIPLAMMSNDDESTIIRERILTDGSTTSVMRKDIVAEFVRVKSDGNKDAYAVARFIRKRS